MSFLDKVFIIDVELEWSKMRPRHDHEHNHNDHSHDRIAAEDEEKIVNTTLRKDN